MGASEIIGTDSTACRRCRHCVRLCPVDAIRITETILEIDSRRCVGCGACVWGCSQAALTVPSATATVLRLLEEGELVAIVPLQTRLLLPSAEWSVWEAAMLSIGFHAVEDGAPARRLLDLMYEDRLAKGEFSQRSIRSSCPVVVNLIERFRPDLVDFLAPFATEYEVQARIVAEVYPGRPRSVVVAPCLGARRLIERGERALAAVISPNDLLRTLNERGAALGVELGVESVSVPVVPSGPDLALLLAGLPARHDFEGSVGVTDLWGCGLCLAADRGSDGLRDEQLRPLHRLTATAGFTPRPQTRKTIEAARVVESLAAAGLSKAESRLNCTICGYATCEDQAKAVIRGDSDWSACLPAEKSRWAAVDSKPHIQTSIDQLTGLLNRWGLLEVLERELKRARRYTHELSFAAFTVEGVEEIAGVYGRRASERAIVLLSQLLARQARETDLFARGGSDTFIMMLPETGAKAAAEITNRLQEKVAATVFWLEEDVGARLVVRVGTVEAPAEAATAASVIDEIERALSPDHDARAAGVTEV